MTEREAVAQKLYEIWRARIAETHSWPEAPEEWAHMTADKKLSWVEDANDAIAALGWQKVGPDQVVVPKEPSEEMVAAGWFDHPRRVYRAMIEARPK